MKKIFSLLLSALLISSTVRAAVGWPANYGGVMLQGFQWDSFVDTQWTNLEKQADELAEFFSLIWVPQSGNCNTTYNQMGYAPVYWYDHNSSFGTESQLRSMISTFAAKGLGVIEDVVINHRNNLGAGGSWVDFPAETYGGKTWQLLPTDVCRDDDSGKTKAWADNNGVAISSNYDTGEGWEGYRDLDHNSKNVQENVKNYLNFLLHDLGYVGFRYDMTKGYSASFTGMYNAAANPTYSVGEYWDGNVDALRNWVNGTKVGGVAQSAVFDFATRYTCRDAFNSNNWNRVDGTWGLAATEMKQFAITFCENHDTQDRGNGVTQDPLKSNIAAANAFILGMPGTPCVFLPHWQQYKQEIKNMIEMRRLTGIHNMSNAAKYSSSNGYAYKVEGDKATMLVAIGNYNYTGTLYIKAIAGQNYSYWVKNDADLPWVDLPSGRYSASSMSVTFTALSKNSSTLVYTLDGSAPTATSAKIESGKSLSIAQGNTTLTVGLLVNGTVKNIISRHYSIEPFQPHTATVYLKDPGWSEVYFYSWANDAGNTQLLGSWPGTKQTQKKTIGSTEYYYHTFNINSDGYSFNIIFNQGRDKAQTVDIGPISDDVYFEIGETIGGKFTVNDITADVVASVPSLLAPAAPSAAVYNLAGQRVAADYKGVVIKNGQKILQK